jgi:2-methylcitrate dehydratase PrpD
VSPTSGAAAQLGNFIASTCDLSHELKHEAKRSVVNFCAAALGAASAPVVQSAVKVLRTYSGAPTATLIGQGQRLDSVSASFVNAVAGNLFDFDDTHLDTVIHPIAPVFPAVLAIAEERGLAGLRCSKRSYSEPKWNAGWDCLYLLGITLEAGISQLHVACLAPPLRHRNFSN